MEKNKNFLVFSIGFSLIFFSFAAAQQYLTVEFENISKTNIAFTSLLLIYLFATIFSPISAFIVPKITLKKALILPSIVYLCFGAIVITRNEILIYFISILLGIASSILWTACGTYLLSITEKIHYGKAIGMFNTLFSLMCILGILSLGVLLSYFSYEISYGIILIPEIAGLILLFLINEVKTTTSKIKNATKIFFSPKFLIFFPLYAVQGFLFSMTIGIIPIEINEILPEIFVGIIGMLFYLLPILSYEIGKISDRFGRPVLFIIFYVLISISMLMLIIKEIFILGIIIFAFSFSFTKTLLIAYIGDLAKGKDLETMNALFNTALNLGVVLGFVAFIIISDRNVIYIISFVATILSLLGFFVEKI